MFKKLIALLAMLFILLGNLFSTGVDQDKKNRKEENPRVVVLNDHNFHLDLKELRTALKELESLELPEFDISVDFTEMNRELAEIPRAFAEVKRELADLDGLDIRVELKGIEKSLESLPASLKSMRKELKRINVPDINAILDNSLKSLEGLDQRIKAAIDAAFDSLDED